VTHAATVGGGLYVARHRHRPRRWESDQICDSVGNIGGNDDELSVPSQIGDTTPVAELTTSTHLQQTRRAKHELASSTTLYPVSRELGLFLLGQVLNMQIMLKYRK